MSGTALPSIDATPSHAMKNYDVLIIGSGLAGMSLALRLAATQKVALITKTELLDAASAWAQGGIAAVLGDDDAPENHIRDTHVAGAGLCKDEVVRFVVENGRRSVEWLMEQGVPFTRDEEAPGASTLTLRAPRRTPAKRGVPSPSG